MITVTEALSHMIKSCKLSDGKHDQLFRGQDSIILHSGSEVTEVWSLVIVHEASKRRSCVRREGVDRCRMRQTT